MKKFLDLAERFAADQQGAAMIEYTVLVGIITATVVATIISVGGWVNTHWTEFNNGLSP